MRYIKAFAFRALPLGVNWRVNDEYGKPSDAIEFALAFLQVGLLLLAVAGIRLAGSWRLPFVLGSALFCLLHMAVVCRMRYLLPVMPIIALFAAVALQRWIPEGGTITRR